MVIPSNFGRRQVTEQELKFFDNRELLLAKETLEKEIDQLAKQIETAEKRQESIKRGAAKPRSSTRKAVSHIERISDALVEIDSFIFTMGLKLQQKRNLLNAIHRRLV